MKNPVIRCDGAGAEYSDYNTNVVLMRTHFPQAVIASAAWQSRRRSKHRSPVEIAIRQRRTTLLAMTKWVRVSNVVKLYQAVARDPTQIAFYDPGLGTFSFRGREVDGCRAAKVAAIA